MNKIMKALLEKHFSVEQLSSIIEVIEATPNAEVAVELICGLYQQPSLFPMSDIPNYGECRFIKYDKWRNQIEFNHLKDKKVSIYVDKDQDISVITKDNYTEYKKPWKDGQVRYLEINLEEKELCHQTISAETWEKYGFYPDSMVP